MSGLIVDAAVDSVSKLSGKNMLLIKSGAVVSDVVAFGGALAANAHAIIPNPATWDWLPGDYIVVLAQDIFGSALTVPAWLSRLDGLGATVDPAFMGGYIVDGLDHWTSVQDGAGNMVPAYRITYVNTQDNAKHIVLARYRKVASVVAVAGEIFDNSPTNVDLAALNIPTNGVGIMLGNVRGNGTQAATLADFVAQGVGIVDRYPGVIGKRAYEVPGPLTGYQFTVNNNAALSNDNFFEAAALTPGPALYTPTTTPTFVAAGALQTVKVGSTVTVAPPSGLNAGDLLMIVTHSRDNAGDSFGDETLAPAGWKRFGRLSSNARDVRVDFKRAIGGGSDPSEVLYVYSGTGQLEARMYAYRGVGGVKWVGGASAQTMTPLMNTDVANTLAIAAFGSDFYTISSLTLGSWTQRDLQPQASSGGIALAELLMASPGAPGCPTLVQSGGSTGSIAMFYLLPAN